MDRLYPNAGTDYASLSAPLWIAGLWYLLRDRNGTGLRVLSWTFRTVLSGMLVLHDRIYYMAPAYPMLFAAGAVGFQDWVERHSWSLLKPAYIAAPVVTSAIFVPFAYFPMPTVDQYIAYSKFMHLAPPRIENHKQGPLPQLYTDQFGRKEMAQVVAEASLSLDSLLLYAG